MAASSKIIVVMEEIDGEIVQSPSNTKAYKTFKGAINNTRPTYDTTHESKNCVIIQGISYYRKPETFYLVDISKPAAEIVKDVQQLTS